MSTAINLSVRQRANLGMALAPTERAGLKAIKTFAYLLGTQLAAQAPGIALALH